MGHGNHLGVLNIVSVDQWQYVHSKSQKMVHCSSPFGLFSVLNILRTILCPRKSWKWTRVPMFPLVVGGQSMPSVSLQRDADQWRPVRSRNLQKIRYSGLGRIIRTAQNPPFWGGKRDLLRLTLLHNQRDEPVSTDTRRMTSNIEQPDRSGTKFPAHINSGRKTHAVRRMSISPRKNHYIL